MRLDTWSEPGILTNYRSNGAQLHFQNRLVSPGDIALPFNHLACEALLFVPFSLLSHRAAYFALLGLNVTGLAITFKLLRPGMKNLAAIYRWLPLPCSRHFFQSQPRFFKDRIQFCSCGQTREPEAPTGTRPGSVRERTDCR
jgi:hypothetical protein